MFKFDRKKFYDRFRAWRGSITSQQVRGLNFLLDALEQDPHVTRIDWASYMLATVMLETAYTFLPIHEYGGKSYFINRYGGQTRKGKELGNDTPEEGFDYAGKGFPQTTGESNYEKSEVALRREYPAIVADFEKRTGKKFDLTVGDQPNDKADPQNMLDPQIAYAVMSYGMRSGMFTGHKLSQHLNDRKKDYVNARRIINGTDKANTIAGYAVKFEAILKASLVNEFSDLTDEEIQLEIPAASSLTQKPTTDNLTPPIASGNTSESAAGDEGAVNPPQPETKVEVKDGNVKVETSNTDTPPEKVAIEKPESRGFLSRIWKKVTGLTGGTVTTDIITEKAAQAQALGLSPETWKRIFYIIAAGVAVYLIYELVNYILEVKRDKDITADLLKANTSENNKVVLVDKESVEDYKRRGYEIVTR